MDRLITVFGGGGFLGRYVVQELIKTGARIRIASRDPKSSWFLKPLGGLGQTQFVAADITRAGSVVVAVRGSDAVVNLVGILKGDYQRVHVDGARHVAEAAAAAGAGAIVHVSAIGADAEAASAYARSKGQGEAVVKAAFAGATIIRPSIVFGPEDDFVNRFAKLAEKLPVIPIIRPNVRFQPVFVSDVAHGVSDATVDPLAHAGKTYSLGGPGTITMRALNEWIGVTTGRKRALVDVPDEIAALIAKLGGFLPGAPITWDQWLMLQHDNVVPEGAAGFVAFGIDPVPLSVAAPRWLVRYRRAGRFSSARTA